jgi:hypothetical protein
MLDHFRRQQLEVNGVSINLRHSGEGESLSVRSQAGTEGG